MTFPFFIRLGVLFLLGVVPLSAQSPTPKVRWVCSTEKEPWREMSPLIVTGVPVNGTGVVPMKIDSAIKFQKNIGVGGCFNELAWKAIEPLGAIQRVKVFEALFGSSGCNFSACREGIGANDFAAPIHKGLGDNDAWYSLDETAGDYPMDHFTLDEDRKILIPFIKEAMKYQPKLQIWGVPWSPPSWMKTTGQYKGGWLKQDEQTLRAYALYFAKYAQGYLHERIPLRAVMPQNEPSFNSGKYPQCRWKAKDLVSFLREYLIPEFKKDGVPVEIWLGTIVSNKIEDFTDPAMTDPAVGPSIVGVGYQYGGTGTMMATHTAYPDKFILQTETSCHKGDNLWKEGMKTFEEIIDEANNFSNGYMFWNMVLDEKGTSSWGWRQNTMITVNSQTKEVTYNPEFYSMKHFGNLVQPQAIRVKSELTSFPKTVAFQNPSGELVLLFSNSTTNTVKASVQLGNSIAQMEVPPLSMNSVVISP